MTIYNNPRPAATSSSIEIPRPAAASSCIETPRTGANSDMINVAGKIVAGVGAGFIIYKLGITILGRFSERNSLPLG